MIAVRMCRFEDICLGGGEMGMEAIMASNGLVMVERTQVRLKARTGHGGEKVA